MNTPLDNWKKQTKLFLFSQTISLFGSSVVQYAIIWYVTLATSSGAMLTISTACGFLPQIVISLFAGVWVDRYDRKKLIMYSDSAIAVSTLIVAGLFLNGYQNIWLLFAVLFIRSIGTGIQIPAINAIIPQIVPTEKLMKVNGIYSTINSLMMFLAPAVSGFILSISNIETTFFIDVFTAIIGVGILFTIKVARLEKPKQSQKSHIAEIKQGFSYLKEHIFIKDLLIFQLIVVILVSPSAFLTPLMVARSFGAEVWRLTASEMTFSAGAILGGIAIALLGSFKNRMYTTILACVFYGLLSVGLGLAPTFITYLIINTLIGLTMPLYSAPITVIIQESVEPHMHGRVFSFMQIATSCALPLGMMIFGPMADVIKVQSLLIVCGSAVVVTAMYAFYSKRFKIN